MSVLRFMQTPSGRVIRILAGLVLLVYGSLHPSLAAIVGMMTGVVIMVTGFAGVPSPPRPHDRRV